MDNKTIEYYIPITTQKRVDEYNKNMFGTFGEDFIPALTAEDHMDILIDKLFTAVEEIWEDGGGYYGDDIKVKIELEYQPESK